MPGGARFISSEAPIAAPRLDADGRGDLVERRLDLRAAGGQRARRVELAHARFGGRAANGARACRRLRRGGRRPASAPDRSTAAARGAAIRARQPQRGRRGHGRLADAALAAEEQERRPAEARREAIGRSAGRGPARRAPSRLPLSIATAGRCRGPERRRAAAHRASRAALAPRLASCIDGIRRGSRAIASASHHRVTRPLVRTAPVAHRTRRSVGQRRD